MALAPLSLSNLAPPRATGDARVFQPSDYPLRLIEDQPSHTSHWAKVLAGSLAAHILFFVIAIRLPSFVARAEPNRRVLQHRIPLYLPPDLMTQKAPNRTKPTKEIDLAALLAQQQEQRPSPASPAPSIRHFELPRQAAPRPINKNSVKILPEAPAVAANQPSTALPAGAINGLPTPAPPPPPAATASPFENVGTEAPPNPHPKLAPPKNTVQAAVKDLTQNPAGRDVVITGDSNGTRPTPGTPGLTGQAAAQHAAIELKSDPQGADFKPYLTQILAIVRANWRHVIPESVRLGTLRGRTVIEFIINRDGSIPKLVTAESSGLDPLDEAAVAGLSMSNPLPPLPADFKGMQVRLAFSFAYNMPSQ